MNFCTDYRLHYSAVFRFGADHFDYKLDWKNIKRFMMFSSSTFISFWIVLHWLLVVIFAEDWLCGNGITFALIACHSRFQPKI